MAASAPHAPDGAGIAAASASASTLTTAAMAARTFACPLPWSAARAARWSLGADDCRTVNASRITTTD